MLPSIHVYMHVYILFCFVWFTFDLYQVGLVRLFRSETGVVVIVKLFYKLRDCLALSQHAVSSVNFIKWPSIMEMFKSFLCLKIFVIIPDVLTEVGSGLLEVQECIDFFTDFDFVSNFPTSQPVQ